MRKHIIYLSALLSLTACFTSCEGMLSSKEDIYLTDEMLDTKYTQLFNFANKTYSNVQNGFNDIDDNLFATVSDEAQYVTTTSQAQRFNEGSWNQFYNPDNFYAKGYQGIYDVNYFLEYSVDYKKQLAQNRDTLSADNKRKYADDVVDIERFRSEARILRCYYYFELIKRYGGVPLVTKTFANADEANLPRESFETIVDFIVNEIDSSLVGLVTSWDAAGMPAKDGRITQGAALCIKARTLLYAASPLNNPTNDKSKWVRSAQAFQDIIATGRYALFTDYQTLFLENVTTEKSKEIIWSVRMSANNQMERKNYPIGTAGGNTGVCPSHNLVMAYEHKTINPTNPYAGMDPRYIASIANNGTTWTARQLEIWTSGVDDQAKKNTSTTGYYLKKFLNDNLNLTNDVTKNRSWIVFRYAEILLGYAEAMNEAYGPDDKQSNSLTAREALNMVRLRTGVALKAITVALVPDMLTLQTKIKNERRVELAFEDHRYWDLCRWKDAEVALNKPILGVKVEKIDNKFVYTEFTVSERKFIAPKMYLYPIPQSEIVKTDGKVTQNPGW